MRDPSFGWRTDLMLRRLAGSDVIDREDYLLVRTPADPEFRWGNFLYVPSAPEPAGIARWIDVFAAEFPDAGHVAIGVEGQRLDGEVLAACAEAGLNHEATIVLTATEPRPPARSNHDALIRPLWTDEDWEQAQCLRRIVDDDPGSVEFQARRMAEKRALCERGHGQWFGAFVDGRMVSGLGVFSDGSGVARYQDVETHPGCRNRGLAGTLVHHAGTYAVRRLGATVLVIVADPGCHAVRIYRSLGFSDSCRQLQLYRVRTGPVGGVS